MRTAVVLVLSTAAFVLVDAASNVFVSSVRQDGRERACPGEVVRYTCTVVDTTVPLVGTTLWRGSAFDCGPGGDIIALLHSQFGGAGTTETCGDLTAQSVGQDGTCFTSVLTLPEADEGMSGKTIECSLSGVDIVGSDTVAVASCPAPAISITEVTPESVSVSIDGYPEDTLLCSYTLMGNVTDESSQIVLTFTTTNETSVIVNGLNLCNIYTFVVCVMCGNVVSPVTTMEFNANLTCTDFYSSLDQDSRTSACPGETITYVCVVPDPSGGLRDTIWSGTTFQGQCPIGSPPDEIPLSHETFIVNEMESGSCGDLTAQIVNQIGTGADSEFNSTLPVTATADLDGRTVVCSGPGAMVGQFIEIGSATLTLAPCPAPTITITELTPVSVSVSIDGYPEDTLLCSYILMGNVADGFGQTVQTFTITNQTSVIVDGLNLCNSHTYEASVMCGNVISPMTTMEFSANLTLPFYTK